MPEANIGLTIVRMADGIWNVLVRFYLDVYDDASRMIEGGWAELVEFGVFGEERTLIPTLGVNTSGEILYEGISGSEDDAYKRRLRVVAHYQKGFPAPLEDRTGPEYRTRKDFSLGLLDYEDGLQHPTEVLITNYVVKTSCPVCQSEFFARVGKAVKCSGCGFVSSLSRVPVRV